MNLKPAILLLICICCTMARQNQDTAATISSNEIVEIKSKEFTRSASTYHPTTITTIKISSPKISEAYENTKRGATLFFVGLGLDFCVATPLVIVGAVNHNASLVLGGAAVGLVSTGFEISGPIRCNIGGSMAYDAAIVSRISGEETSHWGLYKAGWTFIAGATFFSTLSNFTSEKNVTSTMSFLSTGLSVVGNVMWMSSCISSLKYAQRIREKSELSQLKVSPYFMMHKGNGIMVTYHF